MAEVETDSTVAGPLVQLRIMPSRFVWRMGPAWSVLAGALAAGASLLTAEALFRMVAAMILADLLWGMLRQLVPTQPLGTIAARPPIFLPFAQPEAPLARFLLRLSGGQSARAAWQTLLLGLLLTGIVSVLLGPGAIVASLGALLVLIGMWGWAQRAGQPALGVALLDVMLPWLLGALLAGKLQVSWQVVALGAAFTLLQWGIMRITDRPALVWAGQGAVVAALVAVRQPWGLAVVAGLLAPPMWWLAAHRANAQAHVLPWWLAAMLVAALAIR